MTTQSQYVVSQLEMPPGEQREDREHRFEQQSLRQFAESRPNSAEFGPSAVIFGEPLSGNSDRTWPESSEVGQVLTEVGTAPTSAPHPVFAGLVPEGDSEHLSLDWGAERSPSSDLEM